MSIEYKAWPYKQAQNILDRLDAEAKSGTQRKRDAVLLQTGFGPSGLPHIGTFGEVARTDWVARALRQINPELKTLVYAFSDDMDGMRGVPDNVPNQEMLKEHLGKPLSDVPDPFGEHESFAAYNNAMLCRFLDSFGFDYEFKSSKDQYRGGVFNEGLKRVVETYDEIRALVTKDLSPEHAQTWSPFQPICQACGRVNTTRVLGVNREDYTVDYACNKGFNAKFEGKKLPVRGCGHTGTMPVTDGNLKVGWKVDWALRWYVLGVDYEMYGKDLIESANVSGPIVKILGGTPPERMAYEWFNDEKGQSISKSKGNGLSIDQWLKYGPIESLAWYIYQTPTKAKRLFFGVIPRSVDQFLRDRTNFGQAEDDTARVNNAVFFVEQDKIDAQQAVAYDSDITYGLLLNLVSVLGTEDRAMVWDYIERYDPTAAQTNEAIINDMIDCALRYYKDFVAPTKSYEPVPEHMQPALDDFVAYLKDPSNDHSADAIQTACYEAGKARDLPLKQWFKALYKMLIGQPQGPRIGTFVQLYGVEATLALIESR